MASISGAGTSAICQIATTWGTAVAGGATDKLVAEITHSLNEQELVARQIGSGNYMATTATRGGVLPTVTVTGDAGYRNQMDKILAQFMGTAGAPSEATGGQGDYVHSITFNTTLNSKYLTIAYESSSATVHEFQTCACNTFSFKTTGIPGYCEYSAGFLANDLQLGTAVNTNAVIQAATLTDEELVAANGADDFWLNAQSGAGLAVGDKLDITGFELNMTRPQKTVGELRNAIGTSAPISDGLFEGTLRITLKELADHTYYNIWNNETVYKARIGIDGTQIAAGTSKSVICYLPEIMLVKAPEYSLVEPGVNAVTYEFRLHKAASNPTGMLSTYPYFAITNTLSTSLLA